MNIVENYFIEIGIVMSLRGPVVCSAKRLQSGTDFWIKYVEYMLWTKFPGPNCQAASAKVRRILLSPYQSRVR